MYVYLYKLELKFRYLTCLSKLFDFVVVVVDITQFFLMYSFVISLFILVFEYTIICRLFFISVTFRVILFHYIYLKEKGYIFNSSSFCIILSFTIIIHIFNTLRRSRK